jgi:glutathione S-transferase
MTMLTIWGRKTSSNVQIIMWAVAELGLRHQRIDWGGKFGGNDDPEYRRMNPNGLIPTIKDGDLVVWESGAILVYLAARYGDESFWPSDPARRAPLDMWAEWIKSSFSPPLTSQVFWQLVRTGAAERSQALIDDGVGKLMRLAPLLDARLGAGPYLDGERLCFADIMTGHLLYRYFTLNFDRADTPNISAYYQRLQGRPAYREHVMVSYESLRVS